MRKKDREIKGKSEIEAVLDKAAYMHLAIQGEDGPYCVPVCFGYADEVIYFHSSRKGMKIEMLRKDPRVSFSVVKDFRLKTNDLACEWSMDYESVTGFGTARFLDQEEKARGVAAIMAQYGGADCRMDEKILAVTEVVAIDITSMTGKRNPGGR